MNYSIITYGCQMNKSDSEKISARLEKKGYCAVSDTKQADLTVINVCSVRQSAVNRVYSQIEKIRLQNPKIRLVLTGCILDKDKKILEGQVDEIWPITDLASENKRQSSKNAWLPIMTGCNNFCTYCVIPYTRGREYSRPADEIIQQAKALVERGYKEITLLGQNVNSYRSIRPCLKTYNLFSSPYRQSRQGGCMFSGTALITFPMLLQLLNSIPGDFKIKFLTSHPKDMSDELIEIVASSDKVSKGIHLPVQSGNNQILKKMNRGYTTGHYKKLIKKIRWAIPGAEISTDIIVGFPGETKKQFQDTVNLAREIGFKQIYAAAYSQRPGTAAARLKDNIPSDEKKRRKKIILETCITN